MGTRKIQDQEIAAINQVRKILAQLDQPTRQRVLWYVAKREAEEQHGERIKEHVGAAQSQATEGHA